MAQSKRKYNNPDDLVARDLASYGVLATLRISVPGLRRRDKNVSAVAAAAMVADPDKAGAYTKALLNLKAPPVLAVYKAARVARERHYDTTMPWSDDGRRYLPNKNFEAYTDGLREALLDFDKAKAEFLAAYPSLIDEARAMLGQMFDSSQYPDASALAAEFEFETGMEPVPVAENWELVDGDFPREAIAQFQKGIDERVRTNIATGADSLMNEAYDRIKLIADRLDNYDPNNKDSDCKKLRESLFTNLSEMCDLLPRLNVIGDERVDALIEMIRNQVLRFDMKTVREDQDARTGTAQAARDTLAVMESWSTDTTADGK